MAYLHNFAEEDVYNRPAYDGGLYDPYSGLYADDVGATSAYEGYGIDSEDVPDSAWGSAAAQPDLYDYTHFVEQPVPLYDAWQDDAWDQEQYALADLMHYQRQLELDYAHDESERLRRWEERLAWEQLDETERELRYREYAAAGDLGLLGLESGWWGRRYGGIASDLSYLRQVPLSRGVFDPSYRAAFSRYAGLARRYTPYLAPQRLRAFAGSTGGVDTVSGMSYGGLALDSGAGFSLRAQELRSRIRLAEMRASLTGLGPTQRAQALADARNLRAQLAAETRATRSIDRLDQRSDAMLAVRDAELEHAQLREEADEQRELARLERAAEDLVARPIPGGYVAGAGVGLGYAPGAYPATGPAYY